MRIPIKKYPAWLGAVCCLCIASLLGGCDPGTSKQGFTASAEYYMHHYASARDEIRATAADRKSANVVLDNMRLGMASLAYGDMDESERGLMRAYEYLTSGGVNAADRTITSTLLYEGAKVWKGEPYEQAMSFYYVGVLSMLKGDWENARAASSNSLFALRDFEAAQNKEANPDAYKAVESDFVLGYLMVAVNYRLMGQPADGAKIFDHVLQLRPELRDQVEALRSGTFDTLVLLDEGHGPRKEAFGEDSARVRFTPDPRQFPPSNAAISVDGKLVDGNRMPLIDVAQLAQNPKWWSPETSRVIRSTTGSVLLGGGLTAAAIGSSVGGRGGDTAALAGLGAALAGAALKASSHADTRHLETLPRSVYMIPMLLGTGRHNVHFQFIPDSRSSGTWHDLVAGTVKRPAVYYLRMHRGGGLAMAYADNQLYSANVAGYHAGDRPWILGGTDLTPPSESLIAAYHAAGVLPNVSLDGLTNLYRDEGIVFQAGPQGHDPETDKKALDVNYYHHVTVGGKVLFEPRPGSHAYEQITRMQHRAYVPQTDAVRAMMGGATPREQQPKLKGAIP